MKVKFREFGNWADQAGLNPRKVFQVKEGDVVDVSPKLAEYVVAHKKGEIVVEDEPEPDADADVDEKPARRKGKGKGKGKDDALE